MTTRPGQLEGRGKRSKKRSWVWFSLALIVLFAAPVHAAEMKPTEEQVAQAIARGVTAKARPEMLFSKYEFGERGVDVNGYVMTKLFQISSRASRMAAEGKEIHPADYADILKGEYLMFPVYLIAGTKEGLGEVKVRLRQGIKIIEAAKVLQDEPKKAACEIEKATGIKHCLWTRDIFAGFYYEDFDPQRLAVLEIHYKARSIEFPLSLGSMP